MCCACHATSRCNAHATYSLHQPPRHTPTLPGCFNRLRLPPNVTLVLRHSVTLQRTLPCTKPPRATLQRYQDASITCHQMSHWCCACHTTSHCNVHATYHFPAPATQSQRSNATRMLQSTAPATKCHTGAAPAAQRHNATYHSLHQPHRSTLQLEVSRVQASQFHVYKRANFTCTSEPAPLGDFHSPLMIINHWEKTVHPAIQTNWIIYSRQIFLLTWLQTHPAQRWKQPQDYHHRKTNQCGTTSRQANNSPQGSRQQ